MITEIVSLFPISIATNVKETTTFNRIMKFVDPDYPCKNGVKQINHRKVTSSAPLLQTLAMVLKCSKNYFFVFLLTFVMQLFVLDLSNLLYFS